MSAEAFYVEAEDLKQLQILSDQLHNGSDRERDYGHRLWLIVSRIRDLPVTHMSEVQS